VPARVGFEFEVINHNGHCDAGRAVSEIWKYLAQNVYILTPMQMLEISENGGYINRISLLSNSRFGLVPRDCRLIFELREEI
jgi:hypothetical protein